MTVAVAIDTMTPAELEQREAVIERGIQTFVEVGAALMDIRDRRGYRFEHKTFEDYCRQRWGMARRTAYQLIAASEVVSNVRNCAQVLPATESQARPLARLEPQQQVEAWQEAVRTAPNGQITAAHVARVAETVTNKPHVSHNSGENEWYTPVAFTDAAREVMGGIDLDPASSAVANKTVKAARFYSRQDDGLTKDWRGRVWMNPPYSGDLIGLFADKLASSVETREVTEAIALVNNATETVWFTRMVSAASAVLFTKGRVKFIDPAGNPSGAPLQGQALIYFGNKPDTFLRTFSAFGWGARL